MSADLSGAAPLVCAVCGGAVERWYGKAGGILAFVHAEASATHTAYPQVEGE